MSYPTEGLQKIHSIHSWRTLRPIKAALERLGIPCTMGNGAELWSTPEGSQLAATLQVMEGTYTRETLDEIAARLTTEDIAAFQAAWKLDAPAHVLIAMLNPQQEPKP